MKKVSSVTEYAISAFRFYAEIGKLSPDELKERILNSSYIRRPEKEITRSTNISKPTEAAFIRAEKLLDSLEAELLDIIAVHKTLQRLKYENLQDAITALEIVYFSNPKENLGRGDISARVISASIKIPASDRQVYRWLKKARTYFAEERGLSVNYTAIKKLMFL